MQKGAASEMSAPQNSVPLEVTCAQVKARLDAGDKFVFLDCREPNEHQTVSISQAKLLPMSEIQNRIAELDSQRDAEVIVHCHHGGRSLRVANWLRQQGFAKAQSMAGGIDQWAVEIDPSLPRY
jgi:adenylyltransferase/sulfurtransferase